jgi:hypothetical protein
VKKIVSLLALTAFCSAAVWAAPQSYKNVSVVDVNCSGKVAADPDSHPRSCALSCAASGFGIITSDKKFVKLDAEGNKKIVEALKASDKKDHLRVDVSGDLNGDTLTVTSVKLL